MFDGICYEKPRGALLYAVLFAAMLFLTSCPFLSFSQNISGVVNSYYRVIEVIPSKACVRLNTTAGLGYGDKALLVQMKGVSINTSNSSSFGDTTSLNNAGNYELATICYIRSDSVFFVYMLLNSYTVAGKVQLVRVPQYTNVTVTDTLKAAPWDSTTGTGGVLGIYVEQDLTLNAPITADGFGYRGGLYRVSNNTCSNITGTGFVYNASTLSPQNGAYKGEGAADVAVANSGGKGAPANGGGGGNNHNNGGAGGGNLSAGGDGGANTSTAGSCTLANGGKGGKALSSYGGRKIFMGGGGGAGHVNNNLAASNGGGYGGGIIFIKANNLVGNGKKISANGQLGGPAASDGASGAGAGGTIIMNVNNYIGAATVEAAGGQGGHEEDGGNIGRCYGAGGGGSGGVVYFSGSTPAITISVSGGAAGLETNRDASCSAAILPQAGTVGQVVTNYVSTASIVLANSYCSVLLPIEIEWFNAKLINNQTQLNWKTSQSELIDHFEIERMERNGTWIVITQRGSLPGMMLYAGTDATPQPGYNLYRLKVYKKNNAISYSAVQQVYVMDKKKTINIYPNPAQRKIVITGITPGATFSLTSIAGKKVWQKKMITNQPNVEIELPVLPAGVYIVRIDEFVKQLMIR